jgi:hypothetical protein
LKVSIYFLTSVTFFSIKPAFKSIFFIYADYPLRIGSTSSFKGSTKAGRVLSIEAAR